MSTRKIQAKPLMRFVLATLSLLFALEALPAFGQQSSVAEIRDLPPDESLERELTGVELHRYAVNLRAGEFFQVLVDQKGVDVSLKLLQTADQTVAVMDSPNGKEGPERLSFIAQRAARFVLTVSGTDPKAEKGIYSIKRDASRMANARDRQRVDVEHVFNECLEQATTKDVTVRANVILKCKEALRGWEALQDLYLIGMTDRQLERLKQIQRRETSDQSLAEAVDVALAAPSDKPLIRPMSDEDRFHAYTANVVAGGVLRVSLREIGVNVFVTVGKLEKPMASQPMIWSNFSSAHGREIATLIAPETAEYVVLVSPIGGLPLKGSYELQARISDVATDEDRMKARAEQLNREAIPLTNGRQVGDLQKAIANLQEQSGLWQKVGEPYFAAYCENRMGLAYYELGERQQALDHYQKALRLWNIEGDESGKGNTLNNLGNVYLALQDKRQALEYYQQALTVLRAAGDRLGEGNTLSNLGLAYSHLGEKKKALDFYRQALPIRREVGERFGEATTLTGIGNIYFDLGEYGKAFDSYNEGLLIARAYNDKRREATALHLLGNVNFALNNQQKALNFYLQALSLRHGQGNKRDEASTLTNIGLTYNRLGDTQTALDHLKRALTLFQSEGSRTGEAVTLAHLGDVYFDSGEHRKGFESYEQSLPLLIATGEKLKEVQVLDSLRDRFQSLKLVGPAVFIGKQCVNKIQELRQSIEDIDPETQKAFVQSVEVAYQRLAEALIDDHQLDQAVEVINLYRAQQFFDFDRDSSNRSKQLSQSSHEVIVAERYHQESERIKKTADQVEDLKLKIGVRTPTDSEAAQLNQLQAEHKTAAAALLKILEDLPAEFSKPRDEQDIVPAAAAVLQMQQAIRDVSTATGKETVALYTLTSEKQLRLILVTSNSLETFASPIKRADFSKTILKFYAVLQSPGYDPRPLGKQLYDAILKPVEAELMRRKVRTILWGLDGNLRYVPMAALSPDGENYLVERYQNVLFTRSNPELLTRTPRSRWTGTGFGSSKPQVVDLIGEGTQISFPALPGVLTELDDIFGSASAKGILSGSVFTDDKFTKPTFFGALAARRPVVHISGHFSFRPGDSSHSFLILGDGKTLTLDELKQQPHLFQEVELLTLSACNTAANLSDANGREIDGFAELVQRMGANAVMATLWEVSDNSTPVLMREFYRNREQNEEPTKAEALRQAQLALLGGGIKAKPLFNVRKGGASGKNKLVVLPDDAKELQASTEPAQAIYVAQRDAPVFIRLKTRPFAHPYYWAPFILTGNWR